MIVDQDLLLDFAHRVARQGIDESDLSRTFVDRKGARDEIRQRTIVVTVAHHVRDDSLPQIVVGNTDDRSLANLG